MWKSKHNNHRKPLKDVKGSHKKISELLFSNIPWDYLVLFPCYLQMLPVTHEFPNNPILRQHWRDEI